jgi:23S rRNA (guanine745-N1)-methyltransferase
MAREGYVNLLLVNNKHSQQPGDSKEMIAARARVHDAGLYQRLAVALQERLAALEFEPARVLDLGCGDGYYAAALGQVLPHAKVFGIDIAKPAVKLAARRCPAGEFAVASAFHVPLPDASIDLVVSVFAPVDAGELSRLLVPGGIYLKVTPAPRHLWGLRSLLYDQPRPHRVESQPGDGFQLLAANDVEYELQLDGTTLRDLVAMTPYAHKGPRKGRDRLLKLEQITLQMCFSISLQRYL